MKIPWARYERISVENVRTCVRVPSGPSKHSNAISLIHWPRTFTYMYIDVYFFLRLQCVKGLRVYVYEYEYADLKGFETYLHGII